MSGGDEGSKVEFLLCGMTFPQTQALLDDPNVWIGDTAVMVHMTYDDTGMRNVCKATEDSVTMGNKAVESAAKIGDIPVVPCDKHGNESDRTMMTDVAVVPECGYNLFSITKLLKLGWKLEGSDEKIILSKGPHKLVFDIRIETPKGVIFALYLKRVSEIAGVVTDKGTKMSIQMHMTSLDIVAKK